MKRILILSTLFLSFNCFSQNYYEQFQKICENGELTQSKDFLQKWEKAEPNKPEMFIGLFNYYYILSKSKVGEPNFLDGYIISEQDSINIKDIKKAFNESDSLFQISQDYLNKGISKNKDRLDMYLGRTNTLYEQGHKTNFIASLEAMIEQNDVNKGQWLWANNTSSHKSEEEFVNIIQSFLYKIMTSHSPDFEQLYALSSLCLKSYPNNPILLSNLGYCKQEFGEHKEAIVYYQKGLKTKPDDIILRFNIADAYTQLKQNNEAK